MRIGVLSDSHKDELSDDDLRKLKDLQADLIVHCGDFTGERVLEQLKEFGKFLGVAGNMDSPDIKKKLKGKEILEAEGKIIGVTHGYGFFTDHKLEEMFKEEEIDIFFYGHTHSLRKEIKEGIYYLNPGPFRQSMLLVTIEKDKDINVELRRL